MEIRQLQIFSTVARELNFSRAADKLGYTQANITIQIRLLEEQLGTRLFERLGKGVTLTPAGMKLCKYSEAILRMTAEAEMAVSGFQTARGLICIGVLESLCVFRLPKFFRQFRIQHPEVKIILKLGNPSDFRNWLRDNTIDIAISIERDVDERDLVKKSLISEPMVVIGYPNHPLIAKGFIEPADFREECLIVTEQGCSYRAILEEQLRNAGIQPAENIESDSVEAIKQFVMSGIGIGLLPRASVARELRRRKLIDLKWAGPDFKMFTQYLYHRDKWMSPTLISFISDLEEYFTKQQFRSTDKNTSG